MRAWRLGVLAVALAACARGTPPPEPAVAPRVAVAVPPAPPAPPAPARAPVAPAPVAREEVPPDDTDRLLKEADLRAHAGAHATAARLYDQVVRMGPASPFRDRALYGLGRLLVQPENPARDYRLAYGWFDRLLREHPRSPLAGDARAWHEILAAYLARSDEIDQLKRLDVELERGRRP